MCTVVMDVAEQSVRFIAVRDEDPQREWDRLGQWWPEQYPGVVGIRDRRAGGAWMAANPETGRLAVLLNRADNLELPAEQVATRGSLVLDSVLGIDPPTNPKMHGFNLFEVGPDAAWVHSWDGTELVSQLIEPGIHMIAHAGLDDPETARIAHWLPEFRDATLPDDENWWDGWVRLLGQTAHIHPEDDRAIIRDNRPYGFPTLSLLYAVGETGPAGVRVHDEVFAEPGYWTPVG
jgi:hypothetical protein